MNPRDLDVIELGPGVARYLVIENDLKPRVRLAALIFRASEACRG